ncbi:uncharacterized protein LOC143021647 [Oratosquilla oratoria]|uniref:uncharacterized protein LOC143021647 n=1 Tax=Oratosquilla oratoria TaxID=337810 RepID=UPI003F7584C6
MNDAATVNGTSWDLKTSSEISLGNTELQALLLGFKFDTNIPKLNFNKSLVKNYRWNEKDVDKCFKHGIVACYQALAEGEESGIPRRFREALTRLQKRTDLVITQADKGGGIVIMKKTDYNEKMQELLDDRDTYKNVEIGYASRKAQEFKKEARKILSSSARGEKRLGLLEEAPRTPRMRGIPKVREPGIPMRPITSGIGSAPHRLAKHLAKPLSAAIGIISNAHLHNSTDLINRFKHFDLNKKKMASYDVKALFTNVEIEGAMEVVRRC